MHLRSRSHRSRIAALVAVAAVALAAAPVASVPPSTAASRPVRPDMASAAEAAADYVPLGERARSAVPEDAYALAGGCYVLRSEATGGYVRWMAPEVHASAPQPGAERFHLQTTDLGRYLLLSSQSRFLAATEGALGEVLEAATDNGAAGAVSGLTMEASDSVLEELATGPAGTASGRGEAVELAGEPSELADWEVTQLGDGTFRLTLPALGKVLVLSDTALELADDATAEEGADAFTFELADGCATFPDIDPGVAGAVLGGQTPYGEVRGYLEAHLHMMAFEFLGGRARCGRPWHPYGVAHALRGCKEHELLGGRAAVLETVLSGRDPVEGHDTNAGWPTFTDWPEHDSLTYEQVYYRWLERSWRGGQRMFVNLLVDNNQLCKVYPYRRNSCNEMDGVRLQAQRIRELERYIDAQHGGPGRGWFRIVTDPFQARRVMNAGKLAVVLGIEVSVPFDCRVLAGQPQCDGEQIAAQLDEVYDLGVRQMELVNKFDNALSGVTGDAGATGVLVNGANLLETGSFWRMGACEEDHAHDHLAEKPYDKRQPNIHDDGGTPEEATGRDALVGVILGEVGATGAAPAYGPGPHCNGLGLSELGEQVIRGMVDRGMIFDPDHMSARARDEAMDLIEAEGHAGVVSSHSWADDTIYERMLRAGGVVTPHAGSPEGFIGKWMRHRAWMDDRFYWGFGYGADTNGFSTQGGPRASTADGAPAVRYPFTGLGGVTIDRQVSGERTFDINSDGVAHYGLYPDWIEDLRLIAEHRQPGLGDLLVEDMSRGPEAYLQMWERSVGIRPDSCRPDVAPLDDDAVAQLGPGMTPEQVLLAVGQPRSRVGDVFSYCYGRGGAVSIHFDEDGRVAEVRVDVGAPTDPDSAPGFGTPPVGCAAAICPDPAGAAST
jgi:hypothetical protein